MPDYTGQLHVLAEHIARLAGEEVKDQVMQGSQQLSPSTKPDKVAHWVQGAMQRLDSLVDEPMRDQLMLNCGYNCALVNKVPLERARARRKKHPNLDAFLEAEQRNPPNGTRLVREGSLVYQFYTPRAFTHPMRCYCSLLRGLPAGETASATYCQCSRGFVQKYWEGLLEKPVQVELLESAVSGSAECKFVIHL